MAHPFEPLRVLAALQAHGVTFVLVGGMASAAHGAPISVGDVDICIPNNDPDNLRRVSLALKQLGAEPIGEDAAHRSSYATVGGKLDVIELGRSFDGLWANGADENLGMGVVARVASMADLMELKRRSGGRNARSVHAMPPSALLTVGFALRPRCAGRRHRC